MNKKQLCALLMVLFTGVAQAETGKETYIGVEGIRNSTSFDGPNSMFNYSNFGGRVYVGKNMNPSLAIEGGLMLPGVYTKSTRKPYYSHDLSIATPAVDMGVVLTPVEQVPGLKVKAGVAIMATGIHEKEQTPYSTKTESTRKVVPGVVGGIAYEHPVADNVFANVGYTHYHQLTSDTDGVTVDHSNDVFSVGIKKQF